MSQAQVESMFKNNKDLNHHQQKLGRFFASVSDVFEFLSRTAWPLIDLLFRLWIAKSLLVAGILMANNWDTSLLLAAQEYPVPGMSPPVEAFLGIAAELGGGIALLLGLWTRVGALAVILLAVLTQTFYVVLDLNLFWVMLMLGYVLRGPGPISLDHIIGPGLGRSPLPFATAIDHFFNRTRSMCSNAYLFILRLWVALTFLYVSYPLLANLQAWFPIRSAALLFTSIAPLLMLLFVFGFATRFVAILGLAAILAHISVGATGYPAYWMMVMAIFFVFGSGALSIDKVIASALKKRYPQLSGKPAFSLENLPHVVIIGAGFGGITCAQALRNTPVKVTVIDRNNYHLFQPLLYQVATGSLSPGDIAISIRSIFLNQFNAQVMLGNVTGIDKDNRQVIMGDQKIAYDYLVIATGATHSYFGKDIWAPYAPGLKGIEDAISVRSRLLETLELAELASSAKEREKILNFIIVGGGPTGVELAGAIAELTRFGMEKDFRQFDPALSKIVLIQAAPRILPTFAEDISANAQQSLEKIGVRVMINSKVEQIDDDGVIVNGERMYSKSVLWAAGVAASPAAQWLNAETDQAGRIKVGEDLSLANHPEIFVIGDTALANAWNGKPVPGLAPAAKQGGIYVAKIISKAVFNKQTPRLPFKYKHLGSLATIGRKSAVAEFNHVKLRGAPAWWLWGLIHVSFLFGGRNRISVVLNWMWSYFTFRANNLLITRSVIKGSQQKKP